jgi:hypothetical protein
MVSVLGSRVVDYRFEHLSGQTKDYAIGTCFFLAKQAALRRKGKDWLAGIRIICPSEATSVVSVSKHYTNPTKRVDLIQSGPHHHIIKN